MAILVTVTFDVTQKDIDDGVRKDCNCCPIARSLHRLFPDCEVQVNEHNVWVTPFRTPEVFFICVLSSQATVFVQLFDTCEKRQFKPGTYKLLVPDYAAQRFNLAVAV